MSLVYLNHYAKQNDKKCEKLNKDLAAFPSLPHCLLALSKMGLESQKGATYDRRQILEGCLNC